MADGSKNKGGSSRTPAGNKAASERLERERAERKAARHNTEGGMTKAQRAAVDKFEQKKQDAKTERIAAIDENGKTLYRSTTGTDRHTSIPSHLHLEDTVLTHNHPHARVDSRDMAGRIGNSFSGADLNTAVHFNAKEIRAKTANYVYSMRRPSGGWNTTPEQAAREWDKALNEALKRYTGGSSKYHVAAYINAPATHAEREARANRLNIVVNNAASRAVAKKFGWIYSHQKLRK